MLEGFRKHKRWMMALIIGPISIAFVATGIYSYTRSNAQDQALASLDKPGLFGSINILPQDFDSAKREQLEALRQQMGSGFKSNILDNQEARALILQRLISDRAMMVEVAKEGIQVSKGEIVQLIKQLPAFQVNGAFDPELYKRYLQAKGKSDEGFVAELQQSLARELILRNVASTPVISRYSADQLNRLFRERREVRLMGFPAQTYLHGVQVSDEEVKAYYDAHKNEFVDPEHETIQYVVLSPDQFKSVKPSEEDLRTYYEQNKAKFKTPEERKVRHILIAFGSDANAAEKKANDLSAELKGNPGKFAEIAKSESQDPGSAANGGELGWFGKGAMVPEFEKAAFSSGKGTIVGPVKTQFGYHILQIEDARGGEQLPLEKVRASIESEYGQRMALDKYAEAADGFSNLVYEQPDSLQPAIDRYGLKPVTVENVTRDGHADGENAQYLNEHVLELLFAPEAVTEKRNIQAIEVKPNVLVSARVLKHFSAETLPFEKVKAQIVEKLRHEGALEAASAAGEKKLAELKANASDAGFTPAVWVSRTEPMGQSPDMISAALAIPAASLPAYTGVKTPDGYALIRVEKSDLPANTEDETKAARANLSRIAQQTETEGYMGALEALLHVKVLNPDYEFPKEGAASPAAK